MHSQPEYPAEDLKRHKVYVLIEAICNDSKDKVERVQFEVLADEGDSLTGKVIGHPEYSDAHGYKQGNTYEIPKAKVYSYTRSMRNMPYQRRSS